jgi:hypothetical protein
MFSLFNNNLIIPMNHFSTSIVICVYEFNMANRAFLQTEELFLHENFLGEHGGLPNFYLQCIKLCFF